MSSAIGSKPLIPRRYQEEIFTQAMSENIIAALDTGSGKTYIAVLLIRWLAARYTGPRKIYAFIVPKVPLVEQQKNFISEQIPLTVRGYYGEMVDKWQHDPARWAQEFNECDIMVMTAQVFLDAMLHAHWSIDQVALIAFDEAHHARKNHPYNQIMRDFYFRCDKQSRPKIFGMTASPVWNSRQPLRSLKELEGNLCAEVVGVLQNQVELSENSPRPREIVREYPVQASYPTYPMLLLDQLVALSLDSYLSIGKENPELRYSVTLEEIGPYGADFYLFSYLTRLVSELSKKDQYRYLASHDKLAAVAIDVVRGDFEAMSADPDISSNLTLLETTLEKFSRTISYDEEFAMDSQWASPKLQALISILVERRSTSFYGIIFVEQRQVASTLAWILPRVPELKGWITTGVLVGHGSGTGSTPETQGMMEKKQREILNAFRSGSRNLLISTSVGEEGLDFQACDLIVRYDRIQNMVAYLQSRGRARRPDSTYIVMIPEGSFGDRMQYDSLRESEPGIKDYYQNHHRSQSAVNEEEEEREDPVDILLRERYEISSTGAVLTFGSAISLLNNLCALIPRDKYTKVLQPRYEVEKFQATVQLPSALPIPRDQLLFTGALRSTKREAKASAAFVACKMLHQLEVFDDYLLPARKTSGEFIEDADGSPIPEVEAVSKILDVFVVDPWRAWHLSEDENLPTSDAWVHAIWINNASQAYMGLVTANPLDSLAQFSSELGRVQVGAPVKLSWPSADAGATLALLHKYTELSLHWYNTSKVIKSQMTCFLVPLMSDGQPNFEAIEAVVRSPTSRNYSITHEHEDHLLLQNRLAFGRPLTLRRLREDLTPLSRPDPSELSGIDGRYETYAELFEHRHGGGKREVFIPLDGPMLLVETYVRNFSSQYPLYSLPLNFMEAQSEPTTRKRHLLPAGLAEVCLLPEYAQEAFRVFPQIVRRITDVYRAREAVTQLGLPPLSDDLVVEALTLPCAMAGFNNQRLETLGDSVLKLNVVVYLYNKYPFRHEGQLDGLKKNSVSNRVLLARAKQVGLERFLTSEPSAVRKWRPSTADGAFVDGVWHAKRSFGRRGLQDCMEALLGASFLTGGIDMTLHTGTSLQLCFGGAEPWSTRYSSREDAPVPTLFETLQQDLGYEFACGQLLTEAVTHPSVQSSNSCYQRLEFLGDSLIDLVVMEFLFRKFPSATSGQLTLARAKAVCAPALATLAIKQLSLHKYLLANKVDLGKAIEHSVPVHAKLSYEDVVLSGWKYEPPKALSDIMESVVGAILVDTSFDYERTKGIVLNIMAPLLEVLGPNLPRDPTSELMLFLARRGCQRAKFERFASEPDKNKHNDSVRFRVHGIVIGSPYRTADGLTRAKPFLAQKVKEQLEDPISQFYLENLCNCKAAAADGKVSPDLSDVNPNELDDEMEDEFAVLGILQLQDVHGVLEVISSGTDDELDDEDEDEDEVDRMIY